MLARIYITFMYYRCLLANNDSNVKVSKVHPKHRASRSGYTIWATVKPHTYA